MMFGMCRYERPVAGGPMWTDSPATFHGTHYHIEDAFCEPRPDPHPIIRVSEELPAAKPPHDLEAYVRLEDCLECGLCLSACPIAATDPSFTDPAALSAAGRLLDEPRGSDREDVLAWISRPEGVWQCTTCMACVEACLAGIEHMPAIIAERRVHPSDDVISVLAQAELEGTRLTDEEICSFLRLLLPAGAETTYRSSSNLMFGLLSNPDQLERLRADRALMPAAIEEGLRWEPPLTGIGRTATRDAVVDGVTIPAGSPINVCLGGANRDPSRWGDPDQFDLARDAKQHLAFAFGPHMCLGMHLARMETVVVINAVLDRLPDVRLDPDTEDPHITGLMFRAPRALPVLFG